MILKAFEGDRSKNLAEIAKEIRRIMQQDQLSVTDYRKVLGYCDQLEIIAAEIKDITLGNKNELDNQG